MRLRRPHDNAVKQGVSARRGPFVAHLPGVEALALGVLRAVDEGLPAGDIARELALAVLRSEASDSAPWVRAVAVLEGGALRMRHAVELAGVVLEAVGAELVADERDAG